jgi:hypothetical protein
MRATCELGARDVISFLCTWNGILPFKVHNYAVQSAQQIKHLARMPFKVHNK